MLKNTLQKTFLKAQNTYNKAATIQNKMQGILLEILHCYQSHSHFQNILELGCGKGLFSGKLAKNLTFDNLIALDLVDFSNDFYAHLANILSPKVSIPSSNQLNSQNLAWLKPKNLVPTNIKFLQFDMENLEMIKNIYQNISFDLITSNAALQWTNQPLILPKITQLAHSNSCLLLGIFGKNNLKEMREFLGIGLDYLSPFDYQEILSQDWQILECFSTLETLHFQSPLEVFRHLKNTGVNVYGASFTLTKSHLKSYEKHFQNTLTYEPLYLLAQKK